MMTIQTQPLADILHSHLEQDAGVTTDITPHDITSERNWDSNAGEPGGGAAEMH